MPDTTQLRDLGAVLADVRDQLAAVTPLPTIDAMLAASPAECARTTEIIRAQAHVGEAILHLTRAARLPDPCQPMLTVEVVR